MQQKGNLMNKLSVMIIFVVMTTVKKLCSLNWSRFLPDMSSQIWDNKFDWNFQGIGVNILRACLHTCTNFAQFLSIASTIL